MLSWKPKVAEKSAPVAATPKAEKAEAPAEEPVAEKPQTEEVPAPEKVPVA